MRLFTLSQRYSLGLLCPVSKIRTFQPLTRIHIPEERRRQLSQQYRQQCTCHIHKAAFIHSHSPSSMFLLVVNVLSENLH